MKDYRRLHNEELFDLLFQEEDRLPRAAADEIVRRGQEMLPFLRDAVMDRVLWMAEPPEWWAPVHASYLVGSVGGKDAILPLASALRWSDAYDNEWVTEDLPSILGSLGDLSWPLLLQIAGDLSAGWSARSIAMDAMGSQALRSPRREEEAIKFIGSILKNGSEEYGARRAAAFVLLDFRRGDFRKELIAFGRDELRQQQQSPDCHSAFGPEGVERELATPRTNLDFYLRDWMIFYDAEEIRKRQERWAREDPRQREGGLPSGGESHPASAISRNAPCPCGSGRSYKRCCLKKLH